MGTLQYRLARLEKREKAFRPVPPALVLLPGYDEETERAAFERLRGYPPALTIRVTLNDCRLRPDPDGATHTDMTPEACE